MEDISSVNVVPITITILQGATFNLPVFVVDESCGEETPTNLTGWTAHMQARQSYTSTVVLFDASTSNGLITIVPEAGQINISLPASLTVTFPNFWTGVYDLKLFLPTGEVDRIIQGAMLVSPEVTQE